MMNLTIEHTTQYLYEKEVFLNPHHLRFHPALREHIQLKSFKLDVTEEPEGLTQRIDAENNIYHQSWFSEKHKSLKIHAISKVKVSELNPFYFLREEQDYMNQPELQIYLTPLTKLSTELQEWVKTQSQIFGDDHMTLIGGINREISQKWAHKVRYQPGILEPNECFKVAEASCRDLCWMMMAALRHLHIPARFVSGYAFNPEMEEGHELHSWVEAWISGAGWVGFDPVSGLFCNHFYIPLSASYHPKNTMPVIGSYGGDCASTMNTELKITLSL
ncbi:transglutaminase family protein [Marinoscillum sp. MHG1-6]|uniref:transglutaminase family protein n=1 Tax=Marinoscillum sp. MHG1-6 TaxID=2959627 RepID=UPI0021587B5A|nr:transglutaminase family protein [Marinoscillum sp. MHG1-6]